MRSGCWDGAFVALLWVGEDREFRSRNEIAAFCFLSASFCRQRASGSEPVQNRVAQAEQERQLTSLARHGPPTILPS